MSDLLSANPRLRAYTDYQAHALPSLTHIRCDKRDARDPGSQARLSAGGRAEQYECRAGPVVAGQLYPLDPEQLGVSTLCPSTTGETDKTVS